MSGGFNNPIVGGGGALVIPSIHSPNYVLGVAGWAIRKDGTVQFTGIIVIGGGTITGAIIRTAAAAPLIQLDGPHNALLVYDAAANLAESIAPVATTDGLGNTVQAGVTSYLPGTPSTFVQLLSQSLRFATAQSVILPNVTGGATAGESHLQLGSGTGPEANAVSSSLQIADSGNALPGVTVAHTDGNNYDVARLTLFNSAPQTITPTGVTVITGLSKHVGAGTYEFRGIIRAKQGAVNVNQNLGFSGPATSFCVWYFSDGGQGAASTSQKVTVGSLTTQAIGFSAINNEQYMEFWGIVTFSAAGTFSAVAQAPTPGDNFVIEPGSILELCPVVAS